MFHCSINTGYAIARLAQVFAEMACTLVGTKENIHLSFIDTEYPAGESGLEEYENIIKFDPSSKSRVQIKSIKEYIMRNDIDVVFGFDQPVWQPSYRHLRSAGIRKIISYQGAPMSSLNSGLLLILKRLEVLLTPGSPDHYIFESFAMAETAYKGRGIPRSRTSVVYPGVDTDRFTPHASDSYYAHDAFNIPRGRKIIYYSGHMEERKGISVLIKAALDLADMDERDDFHFLILGNREGEEKRYLDMLVDSRAASHFTFGGYRNDIEKILPCCHVGAIASIGWDSFTISSLEIAACGLPLLVSDLQGLAETVDDGETGYLFEPGNHAALAEHIVTLLDNPEQMAMMGKNARNRILSGYTREMHIERLINVMKTVAIIH